MTQKWLSGIDRKVTPKWLKSDSKVTQKWPESGSKVTLRVTFEVTLEPPSGQSQKLTFESLLGHFNCFGVWGSLAAKAHHKISIRWSTQPSSGRCHLTENDYLMNHFRHASGQSSRHRLPRHFSVCRLSGAARRHVMFFTCFFQSSAFLDSLLWGVDKRVVFQGALPERKPERGYIRMFPQNDNRNEGTFACSPGTKNRNEGTFAKTTLLRNRPLSPSDIRSLGNRGQQKWGPQLMSVSTMRGRYWSSVSAFSLWFSAVASPLRPSLVVGLRDMQAFDAEFLYRVPIVDRGTIA